MKAKAVLILSLVVLLVGSLLPAHQAQSRGGAGKEIDNRLAMWSGQMSVDPGPVGEIQVTPPSATGNSVQGVYVYRGGVEVRHHNYQVFENSTPIEIVFQPPLETGETVIVTGSSTAKGGSGQATITP